METTIRGYTGYNILGLLPISCFLNDWTPHTDGFHEYRHWTCDSSATRTSSSDPFRSQARQRLILTGDSDGGAQQNKRLSLGAPCNKAHRIYWGQGMGPIFWTIIYEHLRASCYLEQVQGG